MEKVKIKLKKPLKCPFCRRRTSEIIGVLMESGNYKIKPKCRCGFTLNKSYFVTEDKFDYIGRIFYKLWDKIRIDRLKDENIEISDDDNWKAIMLKAKMDNMQQKVDEYQATGNYSKKV